MTEIPVAGGSTATKSESQEAESKNDVADLRWVRAAKGVDPRISLWACFYRFFIGMYHAEMIKSGFRTKAEFAKWANLAFQLPRGYVRIGGTSKARSLLPGGGGKSPRKYFVALTQFWRWYQLLFASSSALVVVEEKFGFGLAVRREMKAARGGRSFLRDEGLSGELFELAEEDYDSLRDAGYPSLFVAHDKYYILAGPLSLVNERCSLSKIYLQWGCNVEANEVWLKTRDKGHEFAAGERLWTRYEFGKLSVSKEECFCPDTGCHKSS